MSVREENMLNKLGRTSVAAVAALLMGGTVTAQAQTPAEFYAKNTVTLMVAAAPGGMADSVARGFAEVFSKHIPGQPEIIVQNIPGAGGLVGASKLQHAGPKDGSTIGFLLGNVITTPLVTKKEAQFDPRTVNWIGAIDSDDYPYAAYAMTSSPVQSAAQMFETEMVVGSTSFTNYNRVFPALVNKFAGSKLDIVSGYKGSGEVYVAMERGEVDGWFEGSQTLRSPIGVSGEFIASGKMKPLMLMAAKRDERHPDLPVLMEFISDPADKEVAQFILSSSSVGRPIAVPAGVPEDRVAALRTAIADTFADPELAKTMARSNIATARLQTHERLNELLDGFYGTSDEVLGQVRSLMKKK